MTFDDDFVRLDLPVVGTRIVPLVDLELEWPPPELLDLDGLGVMRRVSCSQITDEERARMTHVARGALYEHQP